MREFIKEFIRQYFGIILIVLSTLSGLFFWSIDLPLHPYADIMVGGVLVGVIYQIIYDYKNLF